MKKKVGLAAALAATAAIGSGLFGGKNVQTEEPVHAPPVDEPDPVMQMVENTGEEINMEYIEPQAQPEQSEIMTLEALEQSDLTDKLYEAQRLSDLDIARDENGRISYDAFKDATGKLPADVAERIAQLTYSEMTSSIEDEANMIRTSGVLGVSEAGVERHEINQKVYAYGYLEYAEAQSQAHDAPLGGKLDPADYGPLTVEDLSLSPEFNEDQKFLENLQTYKAELELELEQYYDNNPEPEAEEEIKLQMYEDAAVKVAIAQDKGADLRMGTYQPDEIDIGR